MTRHPGTQSLPPQGHIFSKAMRQSLRVSWIMLKIYIPLSLLTIVLKQWGVIDAIAPLFAPLMRLMGLPGEAAITLVAGFTNSIYAALATMSAFDLTPRQVTILGVVLGLAHSLFIETAILSKLKMANVKIAFFRMGTAFLAGILMNAFLPQRISGVLMQRNSGQETFSWLHAFQGLAITSLQIILIISLLMVLYELIALWKHSSAIKQKLRFVPNAIGLSDNAFAPWIAGVFIGITYSAAILFRFVQEHRLDHKDACLLTVFLCLAHAIIEDTMIFVIVGGNFWWIILPRVIMAFLVVRLLSIGNMYRNLLWIGLQKQTTDPPVQGSL
jgi:hypothetical protein